MNGMNLIRAAHVAVELEDLPALRDALDLGAAVDGVIPRKEAQAMDVIDMCLLCHAVDTEIDGHVQSGQPLHVDVSAYLLARGAAPFAVCPSGIAFDEARQRGHWLAEALFTAWTTRGVIT